MDKTDDKRAKERRGDERVSLHPLTFEIALEALLKVKPPRKDEQRAQVTRRVHSKDAQ